MIPVSVPAQAFQAFTALRGSLVLAFPADQVGRALTAPVSPAIPHCHPWIVGAARIEDHLVWVFDVLGDANTGGPRTLVVAPGRRPAWALAVDRVDSLRDARRISAGPAAPAWPAAWTGGCLLADGRRALLIDPAQLDAVSAERAGAA